MAIDSKRQKEKMMLDGFLYIFDKYNSEHNIKFWRCERKEECRGRIHTDLNNNFLKMVNNHIHDANIAKVEAQKIVTGIKRRAMESMELPSQIRANALTNVSTPVLAQLPSSNGMKMVTQIKTCHIFFLIQIVKRVRHEIAAPLASPNSIHDLQIGHAYQMYRRGDGVEEEQFLLADSGVFSLNDQSQHR